MSDYLHVPPPLLAYNRPLTAINVRHPHYDDNSNILLRLLSSDQNAEGNNGLYAQLILAASSPTTDAMDRILRGTDYYFHLHDSSPELPYEVVPSFSEWKFPHGALPSTWTTPGLFAPQPGSPNYFGDTVKLRDVSCRMSGAIEGTQTAYLCPQEEQAWWQNNDMSRYSLSCSAATPDDPSNAILLRADLRLALDHGAILVYPKPLTHAAGRLYISPGSKPHLAMHVAVQSPEYQGTYHNRALQPLEGVRAEMLYARFAWSIFPNLKPFLESEQQRRLAMHDDMLVRELECTSGQLAEPPPSKKRKFPAAGIENEENKEDVDITALECIKGELAELLAEKERKFAAADIDVDEDDEDEEDEEEEDEEEEEEEAVKGVKTSADVFRKAGLPPIPDFMKPGAESSEPHADIRRVMKWERENLQKYSQAVMDLRNYF